MGTEIRLSRLGRFGHNSFPDFSRQEISTTNYAIEPKNWLKVKAGSREVVLFEKEIKSNQGISFCGFSEKEINEKELSLAEKIGLGWLIMKDRGIPVVPSMRVVDSNHVAMTNLAAGGRGIYDPKGVWWQMEESPQVTDKILKKILREKNDQMKSRVEEIGELVNSRGIILAKDGLLHLTVDLDGSWEFIYCDISGTEIYKKASMLNYAERMKNMETVIHSFKGLKSVL